MVGLAFSLTLTVLGEYLTIFNILEQYIFVFSVKKKGGLTPDACNLLDDALEPDDDSLLLLANDHIDKGTKEYQSESEEVDEEQSQDEELPEETISKKRKAFTNLQNMK